MKFYWDEIWPEAKDLTDWEPTPDKVENERAIGGVTPPKPIFKQAGR